MLCVSLRCIGYFLRPLYLTVTCSEFATGVHDYGLFWETASAFIPVFSTIWFDSGYMCLSVYGGVGLAGCDAPRAVFLRGFQALMRCFMAGMDQQEQFVSMPKTAESPQLQFIYGRRHSLRYAEVDSHGPAVDHRDFAVAVRVGWSMSLVCSRAGSSSAAAVLLRGRPHPCRCAVSIPWFRQFVRPGIPQLLYKVVDIPVSRSSRFTSPSWRRGRSMVQTVRLTMDIPQFLNTWPMSLLCGPAVLECRRGGDS